MERFQGPGACLVVEQIIREGTYDASQEKGQSCLFVLERYRERSRLNYMYMYIYIFICIRVYLVSKGSEVMLD